MSSEFECSLRDKVIDDLAKGLAFQTAFANAAHQYRIFHSDPAQRATYNYLFRAVEKRVKRKLGTDKAAWSAKAKGQAKQPDAPSETAPILSERPLARRRAFTGKMAAAGERPEDYE